MEQQTGRGTLLLIDGAANAPWTIVLAHGAGAGMRTPFMAAFAEKLAIRGLRVVRFEFPYMAQRARTGKGRPPDREPALRESWLDVIDHLGPQHLIIGGKSMGGRIASLVADQASVAALVCLGYPFHPVGKPDKLRVEHLAGLQTPCLIVQGERDLFGARDEVAAYQLSTAIQLHWLPDGDHSFKPRKQSGRTEIQNWDEAIAAIETFTSKLGDR